MRSELQPVTIPWNENFYHGPFATLVDSRALFWNASETSNTAREADSMQDHELRIIGVLRSSPRSEAWESLVPVSYVPVPQQDNPAPHRETDVAHHAHYPGQLHPWRVVFATGAPAARFEGVL